MIVKKSTSHWFLQSMWGLLSIFALQLIIFQFSWWIQVCANDKGALYRSYDILGFFFVKKNRKNYRASTWARRTSTRVSTASERRSTGRGRRRVRWVLRNVDRPHHGRNSVSWVGNCRPRQPLVLQEGRVNKAKELCSVRVKDFWPIETTAKVR